MNERAKKLTEIILKNGWIEIKKMGDVTIYRKIEKYTDHPESPLLYGYAYLNREGYYQNFVTFEESEYWVYNFLQQFNSYVAESISWKKHIQMMKDAGIIK